MGLILIPLFLAAIAVSGISFFFLVKNLLSDFHWYYILFVIVPIGLFYWKIADWKREAVYAFEPHFYFMGRAIVFGGLSLLAKLLPWGKKTDISIGFAILGIGCLVGLILISVKDYGFKVFH
jgi:hypothetical protein